MEKNIVEKVRKFVEEECKKPTNEYTFEVYDCHIIPVFNYARKLAKELGADLEIVELASLLHDIGIIIYGRENHHITGARIMEERLKEFNYPAEKIELVKRCILNHRGSQKNNRVSVEEKIIADADSMSHFESIAGLFRVIYIVHKKNSQKDANDFLRKKLINSWNKLSFEESRKIIKPRYDAAMLLLN